jgi:hypothetical protein
LDGPPNNGTRFAAERLACSALGVDLAGARTFLGDFPALSPLTQTEPEARGLVAKWAEVGVPASVVTVPEGSNSHCAFHPRFLEASCCRECSQSLCLLCERRGKGICATCSQRALRRKRNQRIRVSVLLTILLGVCLFGAKEWRRRNLGWDRPHRVVVVLVQRPGSAVAPALSAAFAGRAMAVEAALSAQRRKYAPAAGAPVELTVVGPVDEVRPPPSLDQSGVLGLLQFNLALERYADEHDERLGYDSSPFDARLYVRVAQSTGRLEAAEGIGQQQGRIGVVSTEISAAGIDFAWFVAIHEYLHTRGATDKYGPDGRARNPEGYANPAQVPLLPQAGTELMARGRPQSLTNEDIPGPPDTWVIGQWTASEIGWERAIK